ncbi:hypothetical protein KJ652_03520 [Patescibacteria group bacterium]|nr:hypothetical protein [Patescibacteria group bacterium]
MKQDQIDSAGATPVIPEVGTGEVRRTTNIVDGIITDVGDRTSSVRTKWPKLTWSVHEKDSPDSTAVRERGDNQGIARPPLSDSV